MSRACVPSEEARYQEALGSDRPQYLNPKQPDAPIAVTTTMPDNKSQHYVPRCHFKPFSLDEQGIAINLYNHVRNLVRPNVSIGGQCAKSYFYSTNPAFEKSIQPLEGAYAAVVRRLQEGSNLTESDLHLLRSFAFFQWCRTDAALRRQQQAITAFDEMTNHGLEHLNVKNPNETRVLTAIDALKVWTSGKDEIRDLRVLILRNRTAVNFVTSDDPTVVTNRVFLQRFKRNSFGVANAGVMMLMPLSPRYGLLCYDHNCYAPIGREHHFLDINRKQDAHAFNELQFLNSQANIYFSGSIENAHEVVNAFQAVSDRRLSLRLLTWQGISEGIQGEYECFRRLNDGEAFDPRATRVQSVSPVHPTPAHWISALPMRTKIEAWTMPGTLVGPFRQSHAQHHPSMIRKLLEPKLMSRHTGVHLERVYHRIKD